VCVLNVNFASDEGHESVSRVRVEADNAATMGERTRIIDSNGVVWCTRMTHGHIIRSLSSVFCAMAVFCGKKGMSEASVWRGVAA